MDLTKIEPILEQIVKDSLSERVYLYGRFQRSLTSRVASGRLRDSIQAKIVTDRDGLQVIQMQAFGQPLSNTYAYWLANNRNPNSSGSKFANIGAIQKWIKEKKSFRIRDMKTGKFLPKNEKNIKNAAFLVARSIGKYGYQNLPKNFVDISYEKIMKNEKIVELLEGAAYDDLLNALEGL